MNVCKDIVRFWKETWRDNKVLFFAEAIGTTCSLTSAAVLSFGSGSYLMFIFISYIIANIAFIYAAYTRKSSWILVMSVGFLVLNLYGIGKLII